MADNPEGRRPLQEILTNEVFSTPHDIQELTITALELLQHAPYQNIRGMVFSPCNDGSYMQIGEGEKSEGSLERPFADIAFMNALDEEIIAFEYDNNGNLRTPRGFVHENRANQGAIIEAIVNHISEFYPSGALGVRELSLLEYLDIHAQYMQSKFVPGPKNNDFNMYNLIKSLLADKNLSKVRQSKIGPVAVSTAEIVLEENWYEDEADEDFIPGVFPRLQITSRYPDGKKTSFIYYHDATATFVETKPSKDGSQPFSPHVEAHAESILRYEGLLLPTRSAVREIQRALDEIYDRQQDVA